MWPILKTCAVVLVCLHVTSAQNFISMVRNCRDNHSERLNECLVDAMKKIQPRLAGGIPELKLPRLEPLELGSFNMSQHQGPVNFTAEFIDLQVSGLSRLSLQYLDVNPENRTVQLGCTVPGLTVRGKYNINGQVFQLPVQGTGPFLALLEGIVVRGFGVMNSRNGLIYEIDTMNFDVKIKKFRTKVENLFGGNEVLQNTFTHFIEQNSDLVLEEVRPGLVNNFDSFLTGVVNVILSQVPVDLRITQANTNRLDKHRARTLRVLAESKRV